MAKTAPAPNGRRTRAGGARLPVTVGLVLLFAAVGAALACALEFEPNDTPAMATSLGTERCFEGRVDGGDQDAFRWESSAADAATRWRIRIDAQRSGSFHPRGSPQPGHEEEPNDTPASAQRLDNSPSVRSELTGRDVDGTLLNSVVEGDVVRLDDEALSFHYIWVAASERGTVIKIDTDTGEILGEYWTFPVYDPAQPSRDPSRTVVDRDGNAWVGNHSDRPDELGSAAQSLFLSGIEADVRHRRLEAQPQCAHAQLALTHEALAERVNQREHLGPVARPPARSGTAVSVRSRGHRRRQTAKRDVP